jgi:hypothetical protein
VEEAIRAMMDGKINPEDVKIEGIESPEEIALKEVTCFLVRFSPYLILTLYCIVHS